MQLSGEAALEATHSRVDLAGCSGSSGQRLLMRSKGKSRCDYVGKRGRAGRHRALLHGDFRPQDQRLEDEGLFHNHGPWIQAIELKEQVHTMFHWMVEENLTIGVT